MLTKEKHPGNMMELFFLSLALLFIFWTNERRVRATRKECKRFNKEPDGRMDGPLLLLQRYQIKRVSGETVALQLVTSFLPTPTLRRPADIAQCIWMNRQRRPSYNLWGCDLTRFVKCQDRSVSSPHQLTCICIRYSVDNPMCHHV